MVARGHHGFLEITSKVSMGLHKGRQRDLQRSPTVSNGLQRGLQSDQVSLAQLIRRDRIEISDGLDRVIVGANRGWLRLFEGCPGCLEDCSGQHGVHRGSTGGWQEGYLTQVGHSHTYSFGTWVELNNLIQKIPP